MFNKDKKIHIDWRWVGIGYCFFIVFLILPTYIIISPIETYFNFKIPFAGFFAFIGFVCIAFYIGCRSKGIAIFESGISALMIVGTFLVSDLENASGRFTLEAVGKYLFGIFLIFSFASISAWVGKYVHARKNHLTAAQINKV
jgi:hypothetical protein